MFQVSRNTQDIISFKGVRLCKLEFLNSFRVITLFFFALLSSMAFSNVDWHITVDGIVTKDDQRLRGAIVTLVNIDKYPEVDRSIVTPGNGKFIFILEPENDYLIIASKTGFVTKKIMFSTKKVPVDRAGKGFSYFPIEISLFEEVEGLNTSLLKKPIGKIVYNYKIDDFEVDKEYAKLIRPRVLALQKELQAIRKKLTTDRKIEMKRLVKAKRVEDRELARNGRRGIKGLEKIVIEIPAGEKPAGEKLTKEDMAIKAMGEISYKTAVATGTATQANDEKHKALSPISNKMEKSMNSTSGEAKHQLPNNRRILISAVAALSGAKGARYRSLLAIEYPEGVTEESFIEGKKEITRRIVVIEGHAIEYKKVAHSWGSIFYFKNGKSVSRHVFDLETDMDIVESRIRK